MPKKFEDSKSKQAWLSQKLNKLKTQQSSFKISLLPRPNLLPLSFAQKRLWFLDQWEPQSFAYLLPYAWHLLGSLDIKAFTACLNQLIMRHESLRTTFSTQEDHPIQIIHPVTPITVPLIDLSDLSKEKQETKCQQLIQEEARTGCNLQAGPLMRIKIVRLGTEEHVLLLTFHHIITDGWSMSIFWRELRTLYTAQITGQPQELPPLPIQFADFAVWQQQWLQGDHLDRQLEYWREQLHNIPQHVEFPLDFARPPQQTYEGQNISFTLSESVVQSLKTLCRIHEVTLFMALLAAFQVLLFRCSGQRDVFVGTPIAGRSHSELEGLIGFFVNTLVLRMQFKGNPTFQEVLCQTRETCLGAYTHQDLPFEKLVEVLQPVRDPSRHPLFQIMFQLHHQAKNDEFTLPKVKMQALSRSNHTAKFDLSLALTSDSESIKGSFTYNTAIFQSDTIQRLTHNYHTLLENLLKHPTQAVGHIPLLSDVEQHQLLFEWNAPPQISPSANSVHDLFAKQVALTPEAIAVVYEDQHLTYRELHERANRLAYFLQSKGVGLEDRVGICLDRGLDLIISVLGVLKSGGAYIPLDPTTPLKRLCFMIENAKTLVVITTERLRDQLASYPSDEETLAPKGRFFMVLEMAWAYRTSEHFPFILPLVHPENLAYVMYTSGSTGRPKGVEVPHRGIVRLVSNPTYLQSPQDLVFFHLASPAFDAATFEIWTCLVNGGKLILGPTQLPSLDDFKELLQKFQITVLWLTAGLFHQMVDWNLQTLTTLTRLITGGDILSPQHVRKAMEQLPSCQIINGYGPTENTTFTCCFPMQSNVDLSNSVPIGKPIAQTQVYVLDSHQSLLPIGVPGELCISGLGLARGYHRQPGLTAERFIPHPYSTTAGERLYRSGDIARYRHEGALNFIGRRDYQTKVRGYRVECGEIEAVLSRHSNVQETIVLSRKDHAKNNCIVAYIVSTIGSTPSASDLRNYLHQTLPPYMIPTKFVFLDTFPLTSNGKVDRNKLPTENHNSPNDEEAFVAPRNSLEAQLTKLWETVLGRQPIGVTDNFFNLGGESLMAVRLCSELERALQRKIPVTLIFYAQTIEQLAIRLTARKENKESSLVIPIQSKGANPPMFCVLLGKSFIPYYGNYPNQPWYMLIHQGHNGRPVSYTSVEEIAKKYLEEIRMIQPQGPYYLAGYSIGGLLAYEMAQQLSLQGEKIGLLALVDPTTHLPTPALSVWKTKLSNFFSFSIFRMNFSILNFTTIYIFFKNSSRSFWYSLKAGRNFLRRKVKEIYCRVYFIFDYPLPKNLRKFYIMNVMAQASKKYTPQYYHGEIVLFQTRSFLELYWRNQCRELIQVHNLPCKHMEVFLDGPHTQQFFYQIMESLEKNREKQLKE